MLKVNGVSLVDGSGKRFIVAGINVEAYRDLGCSYATDNIYAVRTFWAKRLKELGVNAVRLNYNYTNMTSARLSKFLDMAQEFTINGLYVMPSDHQLTGKSVSQLGTASHPIFKQIIDGFRTRKIDEWLVMNPWNEPGPDDSNKQWVDAQKTTLQFLRKSCNFTGVVVLDGLGWSTMLDAPNFKTVMNYDATLTPDKLPNVVFSHHLYPNIPDLPSKIWAAAADVPLLIGELGQINPGSSPIDLNYVKTVIGGALNKGIPKGHNGLFAWLLAWCDENSMLQENWNDANGQPRNVGYDTKSTFNGYGNTWIKEYYAKLPSSTPTPDPDPDPTPDPDPDPTPDPEPTPGKGWKITGTWAGQPVNLTITPNE